MVGRSMFGAAVVWMLAVGSLGCGPVVDYRTPTPPGVGTGTSGTGTGGTPGGTLFEGSVTRASRAYPISGGTLIVTRDGSTAVASDPDRARVFLADLRTRTVRSVATQAEDEVGRVVEGEPGRVYAVARRGGAVLRIDVATGALLARMPACSAPRGIVYDGAKQQIHVACASGSLVTLDPETGAVVRKLALDDDLRDVLVRGDELVVSRFRSAEFLVLDATGRVTSRATPNSSSTGNGGPPTLAFRATTAPDGTMVAVHQQSSSRTLGTGVGSYYGGSSCGGSVTDTFISTARPPVRGLTTPLPLRISSASLGGAPGPLDVAVSGDGRRVAVLSIGNAWTVTSEQPTISVISGPAGTAPGGCWDKMGTTTSVGEPVAIAFDANNKYVVQFREPAKLVLETDELVKEIKLSTDTRADTGLALFYLNPGGGVSCASCHPEGGMDGHVWNFASFGPRVTQPLEGRVSQRSPFHWNGDLVDWQSLIGEVMMKRMAMPIEPTTEQSKALLDWLDTVPARLPADDLVPAAVERGRALFQDATVGCAACHSGAMFTDNRLHEVGTGGAFVAPSLLGVASRAPLMHDGCAATLRGRFGTTCGGGDKHGQTSHLSSEQIDDLVAFMRSL